MDAEDLELFSRSIRHAAEAAGGSSGFDAGAFDASLADLGWHDAVADFPRESISTLFSIQGETNATSSALHRVVAWALTGSPSAPGAILPRLGSWQPPAREAGDQVQVNGLANTALVEAGEVTVPVATAGGANRSATVTVGDLQLSPVKGLDAGAALVRATGSVPGTDAKSNEGDWANAVRIGRLAVGHELVGASRGVLAQAREHALERIQFGQPIARFQAVRHKLAEILIAIETADALLDAAWLDGTDVTASMAKAAAGRAGRLAARNGQQVLAGIGFTEEHGVHRWIRRILLLDEVLGSSRTLTKDLGSNLLASRQLPPLLPL
ncbi:MAG: hypothetical protein GX643_05715 [Acidimicrobiales bacterium]|nr:hypothetical protein [Acidimicrobiales bacterium]